MTSINPYLDLHALASKLDPELQLAMRKKLIWAYSWAVPSRESLDAICAHGPVLELGAGTGYWSWLLKQAGVDVLAFDRNPIAPPHWCPVSPGDAILASEYPDRTLLLVWPPLDEPLAEEALSRYQGETVIYVGEALGGRTASAAFFDQLDRGYTVVQELALPTWPGFHDRLFAYKRKA